MRVTRVSEEAAARRLIELSHEIDVWHQRFEVGHHSTPPGSPLTGDDRASNPFHVSHQVWLALSHATDNLHAFRLATVSGGPEHYQLTTRPYGAYPNLRAAVENAAVALWMLGPPSRNERLLRRFRWFLADGRNRDELVRLIGSAPENYSKRVEQIQPLVEARGIRLGDCKQKPSFKEVIRNAGPHANLREDFAEAAWRILSGLTHGDTWASLSMADLEELAGAPDGDVVSTRMTTPVDRLAVMCEVSAIFLRNAYVLFDRRRRPFTD